MGLDPEKPVQASAARQNFLCHFFRVLIHPRNHFVIHINPQGLARIFLLYFPICTIGVLLAFFTVHANIFSALNHLY